jgi:hypothetical protein
VRFRFSYDRIFFRADRPIAHNISVGFNGLTGSNRKSMQGEWLEGSSEDSEPLDSLVGRTRKCSRSQPIISTSFGFLPNRGSEVIDGPKSIRFDSARDFPAQVPILLLELDLSCFTRTNGSQPHKHPSDIAQTQSKGEDL